MRGPVHGVEIYVFLQVESVSKIVIPILFITFNAIYWPIVLIKYVDNY